MSDFFLSGIAFTVLYLLPVVVLHVLCNLILYFNTRGKTESAALELRRISFDVYRYLAYMLAAPAMMLVISVIMGYMQGFDSVKNSMIWLIVAIAIAFAWIIYRLVQAMGAKGRFETNPEQ